MNRGTAVSHCGWRKTDGERGAAIGGQVGAAGSADDEVARVRAVFRDDEAGEIGHTAVGDDEGFGQVGHQDQTRAEVIGRGAVEKIGAAGLLHGDFRECRSGLRDGNDLTEDGEVGGATGPGVGGEVDSDDSIGGAAERQPRLIAGGSERGEEIHGRRKRNW